jgi:hypothetical protein
MTVSNKRKSMKKINKNKLSKKAKKYRLTNKKSKTNKLTNRLTNRLQNGGDDGGNDDKMYKYKHCDNIGNNCYIEINSWIDLENTYDDGTIINQLKSNGIILGKPINAKSIYYIGMLGKSILFTEGKNLNAVYETENKKRENFIKPRGESNTYLVNPELVTDLVNNNFLPIEYAPPGPPEPEINTNPVINNKLTKKKPGFWNKFWSK